MKKIVPLILLFALTGCGGGAKKQAKTPPVFPAVEMPVMLTDPQARAQYSVEHYWDRFDFTDTSFLAHRDVLEQALVDYINVLPYLDTTLMRASISRLMVSAQADTAMYRFFREETEHYLWDPMSPMRNGELYLPVLEAIISSDKTDAATRLQMEHRYEIAQENRPGRRANDFTYTLASGQTGRLSTLRSEYTLLFFNNPDCSACKQIIAYSGASPILNRLEEDKRLTVLAVYTDEDLDLWRQYLPGMPANWIVSYDSGRTIAGGNLYDLKAIPSLYLLDRNKNVLLKDVDIQVVEAYLQQMTAPAN